MPTVDAELVKRYVNEVWLGLPAMSGTGKQLNALLVAQVLV